MPASVADLPAPQFWVAPVLLSLLIRPCKTSFSSCGAAVNLQHFSLNTQNQEASDFFCWDGLSWGPTPQPWACALRSLSKFSWILKPCRKPEIFGTQPIRSSHQSTFFVVKFQIIPFFKDGTCQTVRKRWEAWPLPKARCAPQKGGRRVLHGMGTVSFFLFKYYKQTYENVEYWISFSHYHKKKLRQEILLLAV